MPHDHPIEPCALVKSEAAKFLSMSERDFDRRWQDEEAPQPMKGPEKKSRPRWSRDELRAWIAHGGPPLERWRPIWREMLKGGTWCPTRVVVQESPDAA